ncbi:LLM class F420-dependent oxidoreductase [Virgisporangium ochraceum]|uniref:LLM class F420-dependent oxidoreductase n=1 Tax=Virgisporangium ochraceum TaxID=65505 RepID=A0A8J3ZVB8_9ACTN|nr:LLM class F420-dependent oxidoreductase [Virgisporangium ochraceum]GIJ68813.1 LLM class F420-dependent oxidoreductase [Virgisporangium ochraceum]
MKLGYSIGYWSSGPPADVPGVLAEAERLGFDSAWTSEAYGSDCLTPLAWWGSTTSTLRLGTNIMQMSARTPAAAAMAAMTIDHLSGGRFVLGLGASGPQVVEGWYGLPYPRPLARTREYIAIVRQIVARGGPVEFDGEFYQLPLRGGTGLGKALKSTLHPRRTEIPIFMGAEGPKNVALAAEIADGWLPFLFSPKANDFYAAALAEGFARDTARHTADTFEVCAAVPVIVHPNVEEAADFIRPFIALYVGGMGARTANFHRDVVARLGYERECDTIADLYLAGRKKEAIAAVPTALVEDLALIGSPEKIKDELSRWRETVITSLLVQGDPGQLQQIADLFA